MWHRADASHPKPYPAGPSSERNCSRVTLGRETGSGRLPLHFLPGGICPEGHLTASAFRSDSCCHSSVISVTRIMVCPLLACPSRLLLFLLTTPALKPFPSMLQTPSVESVRDERTETQLPTATLASPNSSGLSQTFTQTSRGSPASVQNRGSGLDAKDEADLETVSKIFSYRVEHEG